MNRPVPGQVCWVELASPDHTAALPFYASLLGLVASDDAPSFAFLRIAGADVGATYTLPDGPHGWMPYVASDDAGAAVERAERAGGTRVRGPSQIDDAGWSAVIADPEGNHVGIWQAGAHPGFGVRDTVGSVCRVELHTRRPGEIAAFMSSAFGLEEAAGPGAGYTFMDAGDQHALGVVGMRDHGADSTPSWVVYFGVDSVSRAIRVADAGGGVLVHGPVDSDVMGSFAVLQDPQGILFGVIHAG